MNNRRILGIALAFAAGLIAAIGQVARAGSVAGLVSFSNGTPADATQVNANFQAVKTAVDDNAAHIAVLAAVATTGSYTDLANKPDLSAVVQGSGSACSLAMFTGAGSIGSADICQTQNGWLSATRRVDIASDSTPQLRVRSVSSGGGTASNPAVIDLWSSFDGYPQDSTPRRTATLKARFDNRNGTLWGAWGDEVLAFHVGASDDTAKEPPSGCASTARGTSGSGPRLQLPGLTFAARPPSRATTFRTARPTSTC